MYCDQNTVATCQSCGTSGLDVATTRVDGEVRSLCPACSRQTLGGRP